ncbi:condensation domain-containing protein, partial [Acaryochloris sp. IP29b_bin.137]|uniref:condensation domain-containing protein n=1 Tax=Acaryochloris sp. IP29b_bin.137 TaxID=2969217 RepID=UPI002625E28D
MAQVLDIYELSPTQQGMLFHTLFAPDTGIYFEQRHCLLQGTLDCDAFMQAWQQVVDRYDVLRTDFHWQEADQPLQVVYDTVALPWIVEDWQALTPAQQAAKLEALLAQDRAQGFQLDQAPLMRCALLQLSPDLYRFIWSYHHLLMDGWCNGVLVKDVLAIYRSIREDSTLQLLPPKLYKDYIVWLQQQDQTQSENYWRQILSGFEAPTPLGIDRAAPLQGHSSFGEQQSQLTAALSADLQAFAQRSRLTLNTLFQGVWAIILSRYSGQSDVLFGITVSGRPPILAGIESMVGLFINTVPLRSHVPSDASLLQWLQELQQEQRDREAYGYSALTDLQSWSDIPSGSPLFESLLVFENYPVSIEAVT